MLTQWLEQIINTFTRWMPANTYLSYEFNVLGLLAVILVSFTCGAVGSMVVGNRMAFFSDALAHCAIAGVALGFLAGNIAGAARNGSFYQWGVPLIMVGFGALIGLAIPYVREKTALANDTVIGVFFAGAIGLGAVLFKELSKRGYFPDAESWLFGDIMTVRPGDLLLLFGLMIVTIGLLAWMYNRLVFTSFNTSLARSRQIPVQLCSYLFIFLLALIVNLCLKSVGALLINALLIVPAATAGNLARNMRQLFWFTIGLCLLFGISGHWLSWTVAPAGSGGTIVLVSVLSFFVSMAIGPWFRSRPIRRLRTETAQAQSGPQTEQTARSL